MKHYLYTTIILFIGFYGVAFLQALRIVRAEDSIRSPLLITELQTGNELSASNEFVEITNTTSETIDLSGVVVEYKSATGTSWSAKANLSGLLRPYARVLVSTYPVSLHQLELKSGLALSGGHVRIINGSNEVLDQIGWGSANESVGQVAAQPASGQSLKRRVDEDGYFVNDRNNASDFTISNTPTPTMDIPAIEVVNTPPSEPPVDNQTSSPTDTNTTPPTPSDPPISPTPQEPATATNYDAMTVSISEILPDPDKPLVDAEHEMVELHNYGTASVNVEGLILQSGLKGQYDFTLPSIVLAPKEYFALYSADTNLTLANSAGRVVLATPNGKILSSVDYPKAQKNASWSLVNGQWGWATATPNKANASITQSTTGSSSTSGSSSKQPTTVRKQAELKKRSIDYGSSANADQTSQSSEQTARSAGEDAKATSPINTAILAGVGGLAVLYMLYEYRHELRARIKQLTGYFKHRKAAWPKS